MARSPVHTLYVLVSQSELALHCAHSYAYIRIQHQTRRTTTILTVMGTIIMWATPLGDHGLHPVGVRHYCDTDRETSRFVGVLVL